MNRYVNHRFTNMYRATIGTDFFSKTVNIDGTSVTLQVTHLPTSPATVRHKPPVGTCSRSHIKSKPLSWQDFYSSALCSPLCVCVRSGTQQVQRGSSLWVPLCTEVLTAACWYLMSHPRPVSWRWRAGGRSSWSRVSPRTHLTSLLLYWATRLTWATERSVKKLINNILFTLKYIFFRPGHSNTL